MGWAVIKFSGKQYLVYPGSKIKVSNIDYKEGDELVFDQIMLAANGELKLGKPLVTNFKIKARILRKFLGPKITVTKFKPKSRYLRRIGVRQKLAEIEITKI